MNLFSVLLEMALVLVGWGCLYRGGVKKKRKKTLDLLCSILL